jgi:hypothetical protein
MASRLLTLLTLSLTAVSSGALAGGPDRFEPDDSPLDATEIHVKDPPPEQIHNFHVSGDQDWILLRVAPGMSASIFTLHLFDLGGEASPLISLFLQPNQVEPLEPPHGVSDLNNEAEYTLTQPDPGDYLFQIRNADPTAFGEKTQYTVTLTQGVGATVPVNPIESRTITIVPDSRSSVAPLSGASTAALLVPGDESRYDRHRVAFPNYHEAGRGETGGILVTMRSATIFERVSTDGTQIYPVQSGAIIVIETRREDGSPAAFGDPVDLTVQFVSRPDPGETDLVDLGGRAGPAEMMRAVQDTLANRDLAFGYASGDQVIDPPQGLVTIHGLRGLTGDDGRGIWGALIDPSAPSAVAPAVAPPEDATAVEGEPFNGPAPTLQRGTLPVTWSLVSGPTGMTVDADSGIVTWGNPTVEGSPHAVMLRATNPAGSGDAAFLINVTRLRSRDVARVLLGLIGDPGDLDADGDSDVDIGDLVQWINRGQ